MNFTVYNDDRINRKIIQDLQKIKEALLNELKDNIIAILLTGGFGRGEGGVLVDNDRIKIVNDYDLHVFTKKRVDENKIKEISEYLAKLLDVGHIDIVAQPIYTLRLLKNTQYGYDLKHGSYLVHGDKILKKMPDSRCLPPREIERLLFTRAWCFLGPIKRSFPNTNFTPQEKFFLFNQLSKALLAVEESVLIQHCDYHPSYIEKLKRVRKYCSDRRLPEYLEWATNFKLKPIYSINIDSTKLYFEVKEIFFNNMLKIIRKCYNKNFKSWMDYLRWYPKRLDVKFQVFLRFLWHRNLSYSKFIKVKLAQAALALAFNPDRIDSTLTNYAEKILLKIKKFKAPNNLNDRWWYLRDLALELQDIYMR